MNRIKNISAKLGTKNFVNIRLNTFKASDIPGNVLDTKYVCADNNNDVTVSVTVMGNVISGDTFAEINGTTINLDQTNVIGNNPSIKGRKLIITKSVSGSADEPCVVTVYIKGGYKNIPFHLTTKIGSSGTLDFLGTIEFI
ncbi:hypothetical protein H5J24_20040 [Chryseobacterium capnotolerans]|uniref:hypothetical protein n=1 Tax=Chryseobacterium TaxID=59732 RepID=UPI00083A73A5|nr:MULTISPECIES: hypothetical protein [Chryseobacterium]UHO37868.1 hypothetical protein H5J24_20040 [Chryseobacterium capnotolerans]